MNKLYIVRHGQTDWNKLGLLQGSKDIDLNEIGINQAKELSSRLNVEKIDVCICSPMKRTMQTAEIIVPNKTKIIYDDLIVERNFGDYEGKKTDYDLIAKQWDYNLNDNTCNIESIQDCLERARTFLEKINNIYKNKIILIISHGSFIKAMHYNLIGYNNNTDFLDFSPKNGEVYEYIMEEKC